MGLLASLGCGGQDSVSDQPGAGDPEANGNAGNGGREPPSPDSKTGSKRPAVHPVLETFAELGVVPFDNEKHDNSGPVSQNSWYGAHPQIAAAPGEGFVDVTIRDTAKDSYKLATVRLSLNDAEEWKITRLVVSKSLGRLLGFARGDGDSYFVATGTNDGGVNL